MKSEPAGDGEDPAAIVLGLCAAPFLFCFIPFVGTRVRGGRQGAISTLGGLGNLLLRLGRQRSKMVAFGWTPTSSNGIVHRPQEPLSSDSALSK